MGKTQAGRDADTHICLWGQTLTHTLVETFLGQSPSVLCLLTHIPARLCHWSSAGAAAATVRLILMRLWAESCMNMQEITFLHPLFFLPFSLSFPLSSFFSLHPFYLKQPPPNTHTQKQSVGSCPPLRYLSPPFTDLGQSSELSFCAARPPHTKASVM